MALSLEAITDFKHKENQSPAKGPSRAQCCIQHPGWVQRNMPVIPAPQEVEEGGFLEPRN